MQKSVIAAIVVGAGIAGGLAVAFLKSGDPEAELTADQQTILIDRGAGQVIPGVGVGEGTGQGIPGTGEGDGTGQGGGGTGQPPGENHVHGSGAAFTGAGGGATAPNSTQVRLTGTLTLPADAPAGGIQIDVNGPAPTAGTGGPNDGSVPPGASGPLFTSRLQKAGPFTLMIPKKTGQVQLTIFLGVTGDDPGKVGPANIYSWGPLEVSSDDISDIKLDLSASSLQTGTTLAPPSGPLVPGSNLAPGAPPHKPAPFGAPNPGGGVPPGVAPPVAPPPGAPPGGPPPSVRSSTSGVPLAPGVYAPPSSPTASSPTTTRQK